MDDPSRKLIRGYELRERIGVGGFGTVYRAFQAAVEREVAIKLINPERTSQPEFIRRFETEAQLVARLEHLHIVPLYDYWRDPDGAYLVMRWLRGGSLQTSLRRGRWGLPAILRLLEQVSAALAVAHRRGIVHRDIKPANILLDEDGNAYLTDFGIAKDITVTTRVLPEEGFFGSPAYTSPEQILNEPITPQADIYSLGIVLFEMLTGRPPFDTATDTTVLREHVTRPLPDIRAYRSDLPGGLESILNRATAKDPQFRYESVLHLAAEFRAVVTIASQAQLHPPRIRLSEDQSGSTETGSVGQPTRSVITDSDEKGDTLAVATRNLAGAGTLPLGDVEIAEPQNPYKGLRPFEEADASEFFGRDGLAQQVVERFVGQGDYIRFLAIVGPSGSGKSSLVKAGMIPYLKRGIIHNADTWYYAQMTPTGQPFTALTEALTHVAVQTPGNVRQQPLHETLLQILPDDESRMLLFIDQFEELFTQVPEEEERAAFLDHLVQAVTAPDGRLRIIITLRADYYDRPLVYPAFGAMLRERTEIILPLNAEEQRDAIVSPALRAGLTIEPQLVEAMIADLRAQPGSLPLLQYTLTELFERREERTLTLDTYQAIGGISGALARRADQLYKGLDEAGQSATRQVFLRMVSPGTGTESTRRRVLQSEMSAIAGSSEIIQLFGQYRLLTFDRDPVTRAPTVELAHEALIREWKLLQQWIEDNYEALRVQQRIAQDTSEWLAAERETGFLAVGGRLAQYEMIAEQADIVFSDDEQAYLEASRALRQRNENRRRMVITTLVVFSVVALLLALFAFDQQGRANREAAIARSRELAVNALTRVDDRLDEALLLSLEALNEADTFEARSSLLTALQTQPAARGYLSGHTGEVRSMAVDRTGRLLATGGTDNTILVWEMDSLKQTGTLRGHENWISGLAFSPDGRLLASADAAGVIHVWDMNTMALTSLTVTGHDSAIWAVEFNAEGDLLASAGEDGTIQLWDVATGQPAREPLTGHDDIVFSVDFDSTGERLVSSSADGTIRLWDVALGETIGSPMEGHEDWVFSAVFSPDDGLIASGGADDMIRLWIVSTGEPFGEPLVGHTGWVRDVNFNATGELLVSGAADATVRVWDVLTRQEMVMFGGHHDEVWATTFDTDGSKVVSGGEDAQVIAWDVDGQVRLARLLAQQEDAVLGMAISPDGAVIASASGNPGGAGGENVVWLYETQSGSRIAELAGHERSVTAVAYSPDGRWLASASADHTVRLWDSETHMAAGEPLANHRDAVLSIAFSPDSRRLASAGFDSVIWLWDVESGVALLNEPLAGHTGAVTDVVFSPDNRTLASGGADGEIYLWNAETGQPMSSPLSGHTDEITSLAFSPDGQTLASASRDNAVILWNVARRQIIRQPLTGHQNWVSAVAFHPKEPVLATASRDRTVILWDLMTQRPLGQPFAEHADWVTDVVFAPDGNTLYSGSHNGTLYRRTTSLEAWQTLACQTANRNLTPAEWMQFLPALAYRETCS